jgi:hypothetical protein
MSDLVDARGCLTPAGMAALQRAPLGQAPPEVAQHLANCGRCQARLLTASAGRVVRPREPLADPAAGGVSGRMLRTMAFVVAALLLAVTALALLALVKPGQ